MTSSVLELIGDVRDDLRRIPTETISSLASQASLTSQLIPLWFGEGDLQTPRFASAAVADALAAGHVFYGPQNGIPELRRALAEYLTGLYSAALAPERITVTVGGTGAMMLALSLLVERGDNVVIIDPVWPNICGATWMVGGVPRCVAMDVTDDGWKLDLGKLEAQMDKRTKAVFFASPSNPTGTVLPLETLRGLLELTRRRGIWIIADEVYGRLAYGKRAAPSMLQIIDPQDRVLVINSFSKSWAMTGWRLGWLAHPVALSNLFANMTMLSNGGQPTFLQHAAVTIVRDGEFFVEQMKLYCEQGKQIVCEALEGMARVKLRGRPAGAMYAFFEVDGMGDSRFACREILEKAGVGLAPGAFFGAASASFVRLCFCRAPEQLRMAMDRLRLLFC